jgi:thymidylate synthase
MTKTICADRVYSTLLGRVLLYGQPREDRTGVGTLSVFGFQASFDLRRNFPLITSKKVHWKSIVVELLWMLRGETNVRWLQEHGVTIWDEWADENGDLGPVYGAQWRGTSGPFYTPDTDQIAALIEGLREDPFSRRHILSAWNVGEIQDMALPPCHVLSQFYVSNSRELSCHLYQRSADLFLGVPFNIASYALLTHLLAAVTGLKVGELIISYGDLHLYRNHVELAKEQAQRPILAQKPTLRMTCEPSDLGDLINLDPRWFVIENYAPHPAIKAPVAV